MGECDRLGEGKVLVEICTCQRYSLWLIDAVIVLTFNAMLVARADVYSAGELAEGQENERRELHC